MSTNDGDIQQNETGGWWKNEMICNWTHAIEDAKYHRVWKSMKKGQLYTLSELGISVENIFQLDLECKDHPIEKFFRNGETFYAVIE